MANQLQKKHKVWIALSELYLDTELLKDDYLYIANQLKETNFSFEEIKQINRFEVFPALYPNLMSVAGIWSGFETESLIETILESNLNRNILKKIGNVIMWNWLFKKDFKIHFDKLEEAIKN